MPVGRTRKNKQNLKISLKHARVSNIDDENISSPVHSDSLHSSSPDTVNVAFQRNQLELKTANSNSNNSQHLDDQNQNSQEVN